jgi:hypothetical protein
MLHCSILHTSIEAEGFFTVGIFSEKDTDLHGFYQVLRRQVKAFDL